jgi:hypothetical protein
MTRTQPRSELPAVNEQVCPHLGVEEDAQTCLGYPSPWNLCHHCRPAAPVRLRHQSSMCLAQAHTGCPVFLSTEALPLPLSLRGRPRKPIKAASRGR